MPPVNSQGLIPTPDEALPIPTAQDITPPAYTPPVQQGPMPREAGFMGSTGQVASVLSNFLNGWMVGKHINEVKKSQDTVNQLKAANFNLSVTREAAQNFIRSTGFDPNSKPPADPDGAKSWNDQKAQYDKYVGAVGQAWQGLKTVYTQHAVPTDEKGNPIQPGVGGKLKQAFTPQGPQLIGMAALKAMDSITPDMLVGGPTIQDKEAQVAYGRSKAAAGEEDKARVLGAQYRKNLEQYRTLTAVPDNQKTPEQKTQLAALDETLKGQENELSTFGVQSNRQNLAAETLQKTTTETALAANNKLQSGQGFYQLSEAERMAVSPHYVPGSNIMEPWIQTEMAKVGKPGGYQNAQQAEVAGMKAYEDFQTREQVKIHSAAASATARVYARANSPYEAIGDQVRLEMAPKYGGDPKKVPNDVVATEVLNRLHPTTGEKADMKPLNPKEVIEMRDTIVADALQQHPEWKPFFKEGEKKVDSGTVGTGTYTFDDSSRPTSHWYQSKTTDQADQAKYDIARRDAITFMRTVATQMGRPGQEVDAMFPDPGKAQNVQLPSQMTPPPGGQPATAKPAPNAAPTATAAAKLPGQLTPAPGTPGLPQKGAARMYQGHNYQFDGTQWVLQP